MSHASRKFWMVWRLNWSPPCAKHSTEESAIREAERLARNNPGETFVVLEAMKARCVENMQRFDLAVDADDGVPF